MSRITITCDCSNVGSVASAPDFSELEQVDILADTDDWNPPANDHGYYIDLDGGYDLTGMVAPAAGDQHTRWIVNGSANRTLKIMDDDNGSAAANRFALPDQSDYDLRENTVIIVTYNPLMSRWMILGDSKS